ncbi:MAG: hypothetical protein KA257_10565 [Opitutaceae bacterium]|nr:hypothetical protein [Opitutaceae bacterium]MBP9912434.1 hypothetical protein [Opitutaceae bacterium]
MTEIQKSRHIGYGPFFMKSQNIGATDESQDIGPRHRPETPARNTGAQRMRPAVGERALMRS